MVELGAQVAAEWLTVQTLLKQMHAQALNRDEIGVTTQAFEQIQLLQQQMATALMALPKPNGAARNAGDQAAVEAVLKTMQKSIIMDGATEAESLATLAAQTHPDVIQMAENGPHASSLSAPASAKDQYNRVANQIDGVIARANALHGSQIRSGADTSLLEDILVGKFARDIQPSRGGALMTFRENGAETALETAEFVHPGLAKPQLQELAANMITQLGLPADSLRVVFHSDTGHYIEIPWAIFEQQVLPVLLPEIDRVARTPALAAHYGPDGTGSAVLHATLQRHNPHLLGGSQPGLSGSIDIPAGAGAQIAESSPATFVDQRLGK